MSPVTRSNEQVVARLAPRPTANPRLGAYAPDPATRARPALGRSSGAGCRPDRQAAPASAAAAGPRRRAGSRPIGRRDARRAGAAGRRPLLGDRQPQRQRPLATKPSLTEAHDDLRPAPGSLQEGPVEIGQHHVALHAPSCRGRHTLAVRDPGAQEVTGAQQLGAAAVAHVKATHQQSLEHQQPERPGLGWARMPALPAPRPEDRRCAGLNRGHRSSGLKFPGQRWVEPQHLSPQRIGHDPPQPIALVRGC